MRIGTKAGPAAIIGLLFTMSFVSIGCGVAGQMCPTALLSGRLVEVNDTLAVRVANGDLVAVDWSNYSLARVDGEMQVTEFMGKELAREGDMVNLGGGFTSNDTTFKVCGQVDVVGHP